jgi:hypothetical protein
LWHSVTFEFQPTGNQWKFYVDFKINKNQFHQCTLAPICIHTFLSSSS